MALVKRYLWGERVEELSAQEDVTKNMTAADRVLRPIVDHLGTVRDLVKQDGTVATHFVYDAFGGIVSGDTSLTRYLFTSREFDADTTLQYNRARWYDASTGRWISEDPLGFAAGDVNTARYVGNGVSMWQDASGWERHQRGSLFSSFDGDFSSPPQSGVHFDPFRPPESGSLELPLLGGIPWPTIGSGDAGGSGTWQFPGVTDDPTSPPPDYVRPGTQPPGFGDGLKIIFDEIKKTDGYQSILDELKEPLKEVESEWEEEYGELWYLPPVAIGVIGIGLWIDDQYPGWPIRPIDGWIGGTRLPSPKIPIGDDYYIRPIGYLDDNFQLYPGFEAGFHHRIPNVGPPGSLWDVNVQGNIGADPGGLTGFSFGASATRPIPDGQFNFTIGGSVDEKSDYSVNFGFSGSW